MRSWTEEERKRQAERIREWQPWTKSTGPKTAEGKRRCRDNAYKHGAYSRTTALIRDYLREHRRFLKDIRALRLSLLAPSPPLAGERVGERGDGAANYMLWQFSPSSPSP